MILGFLRTRGHVIVEIVGPRNKWRCQITTLTPAPFLHQPHLLLKNFSMYLLIWPKLENQLAALGSGIGCRCTSSSRALLGGTRRAARQPRASAHAQGRAAVWWGGTDGMVR